MFVIAPATANVIAKAAHGIADDMVTTTLLATRAPVVVAPAMNTGMYDNPVTQEQSGKRCAGAASISSTRRQAISPAATAAAASCPTRRRLLWGIEKALTGQDLAGKHVLVTAGPTQEAMDPVRFLSNHSTGKMGYAIAGRAAMRGAEVNARVRTDRARHADMVSRAWTLFPRGDMYDAVTEPRTRSRTSSSRPPPSVITARRRPPTKSSKRATAS